MTNDGMTPLDASSLLLLSDRDHRLLSSAWRSALVEYLCSLIWLALAFVLAAERPLATASASLLAFFPLLGAIVTPIVRSCAEPLLASDSFRLNSCFLFCHVLLLVLAPLLVLSLVQQTITFFDGSSSAKCSWAIGFKSLYAIAIA